MNIITIDGVDLPSPSSLKIQEFDLDSPDTTRNELGQLQRYRIRQGVYKIELEFKAINSSQVQIIRSAIKPKELMVKFPTAVGMQVRKMYVGDRSIDVVIYNGGYNKARWDVKFNLIEY